MRTVNSFKLFFALSSFGVGLILFPTHTEAAFALNNGTLLKGSGPEIYFLEDSLLRRIPDPAAFNAFEFRWGAVRMIPNADLAEYPKGIELTARARYPDGALVRESAALGGDGVKVYLVDKGSRRWIETEADFNRLGLDWGSVHDISPKKLRSIYQGKTVTGAQFTARPLTVVEKTPPRVVEETSVTFRFTGVTTREGDRKLSFETYVEGLDTRWVSSGQERRISLPEKSATYRLFARAKDVDGNVDKNPKSFTFEVRLSPRYGNLSFSGSPRSTKPNDEQLTIQNRTKESINITGWTIGSATYYTSFLIPGNSYNIPAHAYYQEKGDIVLPANGKLIVRTGASPAGINFRINNCIGYLNNYYEFSPKLPSYCPRPDSEQVKKLSAYCEKKIAGLSGCKEPNLNDALLDAECIDYVRDNFGYSQCVSKNMTYFDFFRDEWWAYLGYSSEIWANDGDTLLLRDKQGLVVARYKY